LPALQAKNAKHAPKKSLHSPFFRRGCVNDAAPIIHSSIFIIHSLLAKAKSVSPSAENGKELFRLFGQRGGEGHSLARARMRQLKARGVQALTVDER
jgi:hypothetical protein